MSDAGDDYERWVRANKNVATGVDLNNDAFCHGAWLGDKWVWNYPPEIIAYAQAHGGKAPMRLPRKEDEPETPSDGDPLA